MGFKEGGGVGWFILCAVGMTASFSIYGVCLEYTTTGARKQHMHEISFILITTLINALVALCMRWVVGEASSQVSKYDFLLLSFTSIGSTFSSILSLR